MRFLSLKTDSISGYLKSINAYDMDDAKIEIKKDYTWNYIEIEW